jgi:hypothetical protein
MLSPREELEDIISNGIVLDIFEAEQALALENLIGINAAAINEQKFGSLFGSLQVILAKCFILAVNRLYEKPNPRYQIRSIPEALKVLEKYAKEFDIKRKSIFIGKLEELGYDARQLKNMSDVDLTLKIVKYFSENLPQSLIFEAGTQKALNALKTIRDKAIAHREAIEVSGLKIPSYAKIDQLIDLAIKFVIIVGDGYLGVNYEVDGRYFHTSGAKRASRSLRRLLVKARVLQDVG